MSQPDQTVRDVHDVAGHDVDAPDRLGVDRPSDPDGSFRRRWVLLVAALAPLTILWAITNPLLASPDENAHVVRAQAISVGDFSAPFETDGIPVESIECFRFQPEVPADCQDTTWGVDGTERDVPTDAYPPLFHAFAAIPAVFVSGLGGTYLMRVWLALASVAMLAWAGALLGRPGRGPWPLIGLLLGVTPMVVFTAATVNTSGPAAASAALLVAGAVAWRDDVATRGRASRRVLAAVGVGAAVLALTRRDGLLWLAVLAIVLAPLVDPSTLAIARRRPSRRTVAVGVAVAVVVVAVAVWFAGPTVSRFVEDQRAGRGGSAWEAARYIRTYLTQIVGTFGWLDTPIGEEPFLLAMIAAGFVVLLGVVARDRRLGWATLLSLVALLVAPVAFGMFRFPYLQGRYLFPVWIATMVLAGAATASAGLDARLTRLVPRVLLGVWAAVQLSGFVINLRRYAVGRNGPWGDFVDGAPWQPDSMSIPVALVLAALAVAVSVWCLAALLVWSGIDRSGAPSGERVGS